MCWLTWSWATEIEANDSYPYLLCIHIFAFHFFAAVMHVPRLGTSQVPPTLISLSLNGDLEPISVLGCVHIIFVHNRSALAQGIPMEPWLSRAPQNFLFFGGGFFGRCICGSDIPALRDRSWTSGLEFQTLRGI